MELMLPIIVVFGVLWLGGADSNPESEDATTPGAVATINEARGETSECGLGERRYRVLVPPTDEAL